MLFYGGYGNYGGLRKDWIRYNFDAGQVVSEATTMMYSFENSYLLKKYIRRSSFLLNLQKINCSSNIVQLFTSNIQGFSLLFRNTYRKCLNLVRT